jgi:hypothetical protein
MMKTLLILLSFLGPFAHAGHPLVDWETMKLKIAYMRASAPKLEDLKIGRAWGCHFRSAITTSKMTMYSGAAFTFESIPGDPTHVANPGSTSPKYELKRHSLEGMHYLAKKRHLPHRERARDLRRQARRRDAHPDVLAHGMRRRGARRTYVPGVAPQLRGQLRDL